MIIIGFEEQFVDKIRDGRKVHTILEDEYRLAQAGDTIRFATASNYNRFKEGVCEYIQMVELYPKTREIYLESKGEMQLMNSNLNETFAKNDGFDSEDEFWEWFDKPFKGVVVHWTNLTYITSLGITITCN